MTLTNFVENKSQSNLKKSWKQLEQHKLAYKFWPIGAATKFLWGEQDVSVMIRTNFCVNTQTLVV